MVAEPFVRWCGGKRQLVPELKSILCEHAQGFGDYYEPFVGGGALFFKLDELGSFDDGLGRRAHLNDANPHLINCYQQVRDGLGEVIGWCQALDADRVQRGHAAAYASVRHDFNQGRATHDGRMAALFFAINRWGFNGLWRVNKKGECNVPVGSQDPKRWDADTMVLASRFDSLRAASQALQGVSIDCGDFSAAVAEAKAGDLVYCFTPGSVVLTDDEEYKPIEAVGEGEKLWGGRTVRQTMRRRYIGTVRRIKVQGSPWTASVTAEHPVLSIPGRRAGTRQDTRSVEKLASEMKLRPASDLKAGDYVMLPTGDLDRQAVIHWASFLTPAAAQAKNIKFDSGDGTGLARLLGYYAAEGHTQWQPNGHASSVTWSFSKDEHEYINDVAALCHQVFGIWPAVNVGVPHESVIQVKLHSVVAATFISSLVPGQVRSTNPDRRYTMRLSQVLMTAPHAVQMELLKGWLRGDGGCQQRGAGKAKLTGTGAAQHMVLQFYRIAQRLGLRPSWKLRENNADVYFSVAEDIEKLGFDPGPRKRQSCAQRRFVGGYLAVRIKEITDLDYCGEVYNLDVDGDSLLAVDGIVSHNCDPPYIPASATADFTSYTADGFGAEDQRRLRDLAINLTRRGVHVILSNSDTPATRQLYALCPLEGDPRGGTVARYFTLHEVQARRAVNSDATKRGKVGELIIVGRPS